MPRSRVPAIYPLIQLFFRAGTASLEIAMLVILIILSTRKVDYGSAYGAVIFALLIDIAEILGLTSTSRKISRMGTIYLLPGLVIMGLYAYAGVVLLFDGYPQTSEAWHEARGPWRDYLLILLLAVWPIHFLYLICTCVDCCRGRNKMLSGGTFGDAVVQREVEGANNAVNLPTYRYG